jgi:hypothetical protein
MNEGQNGTCIFTLSLAALFISSIPLILVLLVFLEVISNEVTHLIFITSLFGWIPALTLAIISLVKVRCLHNRLVKITVGILSSLAIIFSLLLVIPFIFILLLARQGGIS